MEKSNVQIEKNVSASFGYVKKDILMLNDAFSDLHDKVQHLSLNHATLLDQIGKLREEIRGKKADSPGKRKAVVKKKVAAKKSAKKKVAKGGNKKAIKKVVKETVTYS